MSAQRTMTNYRSNAVRREVLEARKGEREAEILPVGWHWATIGALVGKDGVFTDGDWIESKDQDPNGGVRLIQLADVGDGVYLDKSSRYLTAKKSRELNCTYLNSGDVLIARMPEPLGRACIFPGDPKASVTAVDVCIVRTGENGTDHRCLAWLVNSPEFRRGVALLQSGSTRRRISRKNLATIPLPVPPLPEQHRIVAEIEKQFTRVDTSVAALKRAQANLKRYRTSALKAACEGKLVPTEAELARAEGRDYEPASQLLERILTERRARWESQPKRRGKYKEPPTPDTSDLPNLAEGWAWAMLRQLGELNRGKSKHRPRNDPRLLGGPHPFIQTGDIRHSGGLVTHHSQTYTESGLAQSRLWPSGTLCITIAANIAETGYNHLLGVLPR